MTSTFPSAPPPNRVDPITSPPTYDEAVRNVGPEQIHFDTSQLQHSAQSSQEQLNNKIKEEEEEARRKQEQYNANLPIVTQPQTTYIFPPTGLQPECVQNPPPPPRSSNDCCICCFTCDAEDVSDVLYCLFCCSRHVSGHDAGCCHCGDHCCDCGECNCGCGEYQGLCEGNGGDGGGGCCDGGDGGGGCCDCGDCDCGDCNCDCGDANCDCGDCNCDCGDCTIL